MSGSVRIHGVIPEGNIDPEFDASVSWRMCELLGSGEDKDGHREFEDDVIRIVGPVSREDPNDEKGFWILLVKKGDHLLIPANGSEPAKRMDVAWDTLMSLSEEKGGGYSIGIYLREDGPLWDLVDRATGAYFPNLR